jgi:hypothetical protein
MESDGGDVARLQRENQSLQSQLNRALKELKLYQNRYPSVHQSASASGSKELLTYLFKYLVFNVYSCNLLQQILIRQLRFGLLHLM